VRKKSHNRWILVTGLSGAGKTRALKVLEDQGFFAIDNLPSALLPSLVDLLKKSKKFFPKIALGMDAREEDFLASYRKILTTLKTSGLNPEILFLESREEVILQRFSETRRPHPLGGNRPLSRAIREEIRLLKPLRKVATKIVDTSDLNVHTLKQVLHRYLFPEKKPPFMGLHLLSFGFKFGPPLEADLLFDVRFLDNPYFVPKLKDLDGRNPAARNFVLGQKDAKDFLKRAENLLYFLLPRYQREGKSQVTVAFGCTGGRHRSVTMIEALGKALTKKKWKSQIIHRDIEKAN